MLCVLSLVSCDKEFLDVRRDSSTVVPASLADFRAILDNPNMNELAPSIGDVAADDYVVDSKIWNAISEVSSKNAYIWLDDVLNVYESNEWSYPYKDIMYINTVLEGLDKLEDESLEAKDIRGTALFLRAFKYFHLAQVFCLPWQKHGNDGYLGLPLRLGAETEYRSVRSNLEQTYDQILKDANRSLEYLQFGKSEFRTRPSKAAAHALLARIYLTMGYYELALQHADKCLDIQSDLLDFGQLNMSKTNPMERFNNEVIFHHRLTTKSIWASSRQRVDQKLLASYAQDDRRRLAFFKFFEYNTAYFVGSYDGTSTQFAGLATNEIYFIKAECEARVGDIQESRNTLWKILSTRIGGEFNRSDIPVDRVSLIDFTLRERRKELLFRGLRWMDIRRLNALENYGYTIKKTLDGHVYELPPNDKRYAFLIPDRVILQSGMQQNIR